MKLVKVGVLTVFRQLKIGPCVTCIRHRQYSKDMELPPSKKYHPRRAIMYVPGNDERKVAKIPSLDVDCVVLDCEDGVAQNKKHEARINIMKTLEQIDFGSKECAVRVNPVDSPHFEEDLEAIHLSNKMPQTIMVPKVNNPHEVSLIIKSIANGMHNKNENLPTDLEKISVVMFVESAIGLINLPQICERAVVSSRQSSVLSVEALVFGSDDFCADIGAKRSTDGAELMYARQKFVTCAKAFKLQAIDMVHIDYKDLDGLREQSIKGANMGFTGKQVIHPTQIPVVQEAFSPSQKQIKWATSLIQAFEEHQASGKGAFTFQGKMIDMPLLLQAKNIVQLWESISSNTKMSGKS